MGERAEMEITVGQTQLVLLPEKAVYLQALQYLLVADVHLGKAETFQARGIAISHQVNRDTLDRLEALCTRLKPQSLVILGDLFHSRDALVEEVLTAWDQWQQRVPTRVQFLVGNHDRPLVSRLRQFSIECLTEPLQLPQIRLSHEPDPSPDCLNLCGHLHPRLRLKTRLDELRLPCFYLDTVQKLLVLPSFGGFTGGYDIDLKPGAIAYAIVEDRSGSTIVPFEKV